MEKTQTAADEQPADEHSADLQLRAEFNRWAERGRGEGMERDHLPITLPVLELMQLQPRERVLDLGCGSGWATRLLAERVPQGRVLGLDISDEMIRQAQAYPNDRKSGDRRGPRAASPEFKNVDYKVGAADAIPAENDSFDKVLSVESFYYYPDQAGALRELGRIMAPGGRFFILINLYKDNPYSLRWVGELAVPVHALSQAEYVALIGRQGFVDIEARRIPDPSPTPETYTGKWFRDAQELREFKRMGALLLMAGKPR